MLFTPGDEVTLTGVNFSAALGENRVRFRGRNGATLEGTPLRAAFPSDGVAANGLESRLVVLVPGGVSGGEVDLEVNGAPAGSASIRAAPALISFGVGPSAREVRVLHSNVVGFPPVSSSTVVLFGLNLSEASEAVLTDRFGVEESIPRQNFLFARVPGQPPNGLESVQFSLEGLKRLSVAQGTRAQRDNLTVELAAAGRRSNRLQVPVADLDAAEATGAVANGAVVPPGVRTGPVRIYYTMYDHPLVDQAFAMDVRWSADGTHYFPAIPDLADTLQSGLRQILPGDLDAGAPAGLLFPGGALRVFAWDAQNDEEFRNLPRPAAGELPAFAIRFRLHPVPEQRVESKPADTGHFLETPPVAYLDLESADPALRRGQLVERFDSGEGADPACTTASWGPPGNPGQLRGTILPGEPPPYGEGVADLLLAGAPPGARAPLYIVDTSSVSILEMVDDGRQVTTTQVFPAPGAPNPGGPAGEFHLCTFTVEEGVAVRLEGSRSAVFRISGAGLGEGEVLVRVDGELLASGEPGSNASFDLPGAGGKGGPGAGSGGAGASLTLETTGEASEIVPAGDGGNQGGGGGETTAGVESVPALGSRFLGGPGGGGGHRFQGGDGDPGNPRSPTYFSAPRGGRGGSGRGNERLIPLTAGSGGGGGGATIARPPGGFQPTPYGGSGGGGGGGAVQITAHDSMAIGGRIRASGGKGGDGGQATGAGGGGSGGSILLQATGTISINCDQLLLGSWLKVAYGYGSSLRVSGKGLRVLSRGLVFRRTVEFPLGELEEVARLRPEQGGPRNVIADAFDGFLVARSDRASVRFGHGLSWEELDRLREAILAKIATLGRRLPPPLTQEPFRIPALYRPVLPVLGLAAGALLGNFAPRPLGICVALPFLEHVLNLGGLLGLFAGLILERRTAGSGWGKAPFRALLAAVLVAAALLAALRPHDPPFHAGPVHDEWMLFGSKESVKSWGFLFCWIPAGIVLVAAADLLLVSLLAIAIRGPRFLWKGPRPDRRSRVRLGRRVLTGTVAVLTIAGLGLLASFADSYIKEHRRCDHHHHNRQHALRAFATRKAAPKPRATSLESAPFRGEVEAREPGRLRVEAEDHGPLDLRAAPLKVEDDRKPMLENVPRGIPLQVTRIDHGEFQTFFFGPVLTRAQFMDLKVDGDAIWVGTELGLLRFAPQPEEAFLYGEESGIPGTRVHSLEVIGGRVVADLAWPTTPGCALGLGGWIFDRSAVSWSPLRHPSQWGFHHDAGTLWIAADRAIRLDLKTEEAVVYKREDGLLHESVSAIATAGREVWFVMFGSYVMASKSFTGGGASRLDLDTGRWKSFTEKDGLAYGYSCGVAADEREVWIVHGDDQRGTSVYDRELGKWTVLRRSAGGVSLGGRVVALEKGSAWFGQSGGLVRFDRVNGQAKPYREQDGIPGYIIGGLDVAKDAVWASAYAYGEAGKVRSAGLVRVPRVAESGR